MHDAVDLGWWLAYVLDLPAVEARPRDVAVARRLRDALWELAQQRVAGRPLHPAAVEMVNAAAAAPTPVPRMDAGGDAVTVAPVRARQALSLLARDAVDLFSGPLQGRIRTCAADDCGLLFVDASRPGRRRWCSMERCGSIAKMRSYRERHQDG
jgi:predicted RNA-binding Zn ribbon-like protein